MRKEDLVWYMDYEGRTDISSTYELVKNGRNFVQKHEEFNQFCVYVKKNDIDLGTMVIPDYLDTTNSEIMFLRDENDALVELAYHQLKFLFDLYGSSTIRSAYGTILVYLVHLFLGAFVPSKEDPLSIHLKLSELFLEAINSKKICQLFSSSVPIAYQDRELIVKYLVDTYLPSRVKSYEAFLQTRQHFAMVDYPNKKHMEILRGYVEAMILYRNRDMPDKRDGHLLESSFPLCAYHKAYLSSVMSHLDQDTCLEYLYGCLYGWMDRVLSYASSHKCSISSLNLSSNLGGVFGLMITEDYYHCEMGRVLYIMRYLVAIIFDFLSDQSRDHILFKVPPSSILFAMMGTEIPLI